MFLTAEELQDLTGLKRSSAQYAWLLERGYIKAGERDARGRPLVLRSLVLVRHGGVPDTVTPQPNWGALRGA